MTIPGQALGGVLDHGADEGDGRGAAGERHRDHLGRDARPRQVDQVAGPEGRPGEGRRRADVEDGPRPRRQRLAPAGVERQQVDHRGRPARG